MLLSCPALFAQRSPLNKRVTISFFNIPLQDALSKLSLQNNIPVSFGPGQPGMTRNINKNFYDAPVSGVLESILEGSGLTWRYFAEEIIIVPDRKPSTLSGHLLDAQNGEDLIGANVFVIQLNQSTSSNNYGFYSLTLPPGNYQLWVSCLGYASKRVMVTFSDSDQSLNIQLEKKINELKEVAIAGRNGHDSLQLPGPGQQLQWDLLREQPFFKGEADVIKALQMQNGVLGMTEGSSSMFIRGGNKDQNLILLDEAVVYNPAHLFGLTSVLNPDALKNIQLYKDDIPANFGGRLSSVIDARMADGDDKTFRVKGGMSLLSARLSLEGPVVKDKGSFLLAGRRSLANLLNKDFDLYNLKAAYNDLNFKINYRLDASNRLFYSAYFGRDRVSNADNGYLNKWGNQTSTLRWNHVFNPQLFMNLSAIYSNYRNMLNINADASTGMDRWRTGIRDFTLKGDFTWFRKPGNQLQFGFNSILHLFKPGETTDSAYNNIPRAKAAEFAGYFSQRIAIGSRLELLYGLRVGLFRNFSERNLYNEEFDPITEREHTNFIRLEPRLKLQYALSAPSLIQLSYNRSYQYLQLLQNDELAFSSLETWIPSSSHIKPQYADAFSLTFRRKLQHGFLSLAAYYKHMGNQLELVDHAQLISNPFIEDQLRTGRSEAYGIEAGMSRQFDDFRVTACYTWSRVFRKIPEINNGVKYAANYDIPHATKLSINYSLNNSLRVNTYFTYTSGRPATFPTGYFIQRGVRVPIYSGRNLDRMPDYHHLDIDICWTLPVTLRNGRQWINTFIVGLYNIYDRKNALLYKISSQVSSNDLIEEQTFSGITPMISYNFSF